MLSHWPPQERPPSLEDGGGQGRRAANSRRDQAGPSENEQNMSTSTQGAGSWQMGPPGFAWFSMMSPGRELTVPLAGATREGWGEELGVFIPTFLSSGRGATG